MKITVLGCGSIGKLWIAGLTQQAMKYKDG